MFRATPLKIALLETGITGKALAAAVGKHESTISRIVNGLACDDEMKRAIANALGRPVGELWPGHDAASDHTTAESNSTHLKDAA